MKLKNMSEELDRGIQTLLKIIIDDLKDLKTPNSAGWRKISDLKELGILEEDLPELSKLGILEQNLTDEIRIRYRDNKVRKKLPSFAAQFQQIDYFIENREMIKQDVERVQKAKELIEQIIFNAQNAEEFLSHAIIIGIWRMLNASDMPAVVDEIISKGFSPKDWGIVSFRSVPYLSLELVKKAIKSEEDEDIERLKNAFTYMKKIGFINEIPNLKELDAESISKVKEVLKWQEICEILSDENIKFLGLSWFIVFTLEKNDAIPSYIDFSTKVVNLVRDCIEKIMESEYSVLVNTLTNSINLIEEQNIQWASDIIFLPEVL